MRLLELDPHWLVLEDNGPIVGLTFLCPHCGTQRLAVAFHHDGKAQMEDTYIHAKSPSTNHIWDLHGTQDFSSLTLSPSIDASQAGHWHGFIQNGEIK